MEEERFAPPPMSREDPNPRPVTSGLILDRFRALAPGGDEVVQVYEELLSELTINSKPIITELTIIAGEQREHGEGIAEAICERILEVPSDQKLPSLYLLDSIIKNIGGEYVRYFAVRLPKVFCKAYNQVHSNMHPAMRHLFGTWSHVFPSSVLHKIEGELQFSTTKSRRPAAKVTIGNSKPPSPHPSHGIHVNPKYLEARQPLQRSAAMEVSDTQGIMHTAEFEEDGMDGIASESPKGWSGDFPKLHNIERASGNSSRLHGYDSNSSVQYGDYDFNYPDVLPPHLGRSTAGSPQTAAVQSSISVAEGPVNHSNVKVSKRLSPPRAGLTRSTSPIDDRFPRDGSSWRTAERASQPPPRLEYTPGRAFNQIGCLERSGPPEVCTPQLEHSTTYDPSIGHGKKHPRELIDAYGSDRGKETSIKKLPKLQPINVNGISRESATKNWRSFEEEDYVWEDMSPTLADRNRRSILPPVGPSTGSLSRRIGLSRPDDNILEPDFNGNNWHGQTEVHPVDNTCRILDDRRSIMSHVSVHMKSFNGRGGQQERFPPYHRSHHVQEPGKFPYNFRLSSGEVNSEVNSISRRWGPQMLVPGGILASGQKVSSHCDNYPDVEVSYQRLPSFRCSSLNVERSMLENHLELKSFSTPTASVLRPPIHKSQPPSLLTVPFNHQKQFRSPISLMESSKLVNQGPNPSIFPRHQQFESADGKTLTSSTLLPFSHQQGGLMHGKQQDPELGDDMTTQSQDARGSCVPSLQPLLSSHLLAEPLNNTRMQGPEFAVGSLPNQIPAMHITGAMHSMPPDCPAFAHGGIMPQLPHGPPDAASHMWPSSQNTGYVRSGSPVSAFSGLISTLMAQGLISLAHPAGPADSVGLEFNTELLKVRHEFAINALYANLPRQCTTCGLRFKCQEEHRNHMDWHVTKNRTSKNRKQKPSRTWFANTREWLNYAEIVGTDITPFLPTEEVSEKKEDKEMAVLADEHQTVCALCGEPFEDFYSDEVEEWMYKGAVYLNVPDGNIDGLDRSQLGPIVHAKCISEANGGF